MIRKIFIAAALATSFASVAVPAAAVVYVRTAPPEPRAEQAPPPRAGRIWVAGHYQWKHNRYQWVQGTWVRDRRGHHYSQPNWVERDGRWAYQPGAWRRGDRDGDGVPNKQDRSPDNPKRS